MPEVKVEMAMPKNMQTNRIIAVGSFIRTIRETGKAPAMSTCLREAGYLHPAADLCRKMTAALRQLKVFGISRDGKAFLYKENWDSRALMKELDELMKTMDTPPAKVYKKSAVANLVISPKEVILEPCKEEVDIDKMPSWANLKDFSDEELLAELQRREDERNAAEELARKKALVEEFLTAYDLTMDDLMQIAEVI